MKYKDFISETFIRSNYKLLISYSCRDKSDNIVMILILLDNEPLKVMCTVLEQSIFKPMATFKFVERHLYFSIEYDSLLRDVKQNMRL